MKTRSITLFLFVAVLASFAYGFWSALTAFSAHAAIGPAQVYRVRTGGSNVNGGGFDATVSGVQSTTLGSSISAGATTLTVASATGWPSSGNYYARIGTVGAETTSGSTAGSSEVVLVTGGQGTTTWTVTRAQLGTTALAFATATVVDNELSRCDTAIGSGTVGTSTASTTFTSAGASFDKTYIGNTLWIASGTGATVGAYTITAVTNATTITLDRASGTYTAGVWKVGGAWADPFTNVTSSPPLVAGNTIYIRGAGLAVPSSVDYAKGGGGFTNLASIAGDYTDGYIVFAGENGRPKISSDGLIYFTVNRLRFLNLLFSTTGASFGAVGLVGGGADTIFNSVIMDQNGYDIHCIGVGGFVIFLQSECYSSVAARAGATNSGISFAGQGSRMVASFIHDTLYRGIDNVADAPGIVGNWITNNGNVGLYLDDTFNNVSSQVTGNTIAGNGGVGGIAITANGTLGGYMFNNNIIANHAGGGQAGITFTGAASAAQAARIILSMTANNFYNNTANITGFSVPTGNYTLDPQFTSASTEDYTPGANMKGLVLQFIPNSLAGKAAVTNYGYLGAVTPNASSGGGGGRIIGGFNDRHPPDVIQQRIKQLPSGAALAFSQPMDNARRPSLLDAFLVSVGAANDNERASDARGRAR